MRVAAVCSDSRNPSNTSRSPKQPSADGTSKTSKSSHPAGGDWFHPAQVLLLVPSGLR